MDVDLTGVPLDALATWSVAAGPLVAAVTGDGPRWLLLGLAAVVVVGFRLTRSGVRAADAYAAERVGATAVADALEPVTAAEQGPPTIS